MTDLTKHGHWIWNLGNITEGQSYASKLIGWKTNAIKHPYCFAMMFGLGITFFRWALFKWTIRFKFHALSESFDKDIFGGIVWFDWSIMFGINRTLLRMEMGIPVWWFPKKTIKEFSI